MRPRLPTWISIGFIVVLSVVSLPLRQAHATFGEDIPFLIQIIAKAIEEIQQLQQIIGNAKQTVSLLEEMNRGVKDVLRLADQQHLSLPPAVYAQAKSIEAALNESERLYGSLPGSAPSAIQAQYESGAEALTLSQETFDESDRLEDQGKEVKNSAVDASQATATRLSAETLGVLLGAVGHGNRIEAKNLELSSTKRIEDAAREGEKVQSYLDTHEAIENNFRDSGFSGLNSFSKGGARE